MKMVNGYIKITADDEGVGYEQNITGTPISIPIFFKVVLNNVLLGFQDALAKGVPKEIDDGLMMLVLRQTINETIRDLDVDLNNAEKLFDDFEEFQKMHEGAEV